MTNPQDQSPKIWVGRHVSLELKYQDGELDRLELDLVEDSAADFERGFLGESTPLARAILGHMAGDRIPYSSGDIIEVSILAVEPKLQGQPIDLTGQREEKMRKALRQTERTNIAIYASAANNKWGDTDPDKITDD